MPEIRTASGGHYLAGEMQVRAVSTDERTVTGIAVPWNDATDIAGLWWEAFDPGAVQDSDDALLFYRHDDPVGRITAHRDTDTGWEITAKFATTARADEAYQLVKDGVVTRLSVGFVPMEYRVEEDGTVVHTRVKVREVSLVPFPAYDNAQITNVRHQTPGVPSMTETLTREDIKTAIADETKEDRETLDELTRRVQVLSQNGGNAEPLPQFRSVGEFVKAVATGSEDALTLYRAYTGGQFADAAQNNTWLGDAIKLVERRRRILNTFAHEALPSEGMVLEYGQLKTNTVQTGIQAKEGDDLVTGKIELENKTDPVRTRGGYVEFSRQVIERARATYLTTAFRALAIAYANDTEADTRKAFTDAVAAQVTAGGDNVLHLDPATATTYDWLDLLVDAVEVYEDRGFSLDGGFVAKDVFKRLIRLETSSGDPLMNITGEGMNRVGTINIGELTGTVANVTFRMLPKATDGLVSFYDADALTTFESAGAPMQLQDENIINLTKAFSVYGYIAHAVQFPTALLPVVPSAAAAVAVTGETKTK